MLMLTPILALGVVTPVQRPILFVDHHLIERLAGATLRLHSPERREVALRFDAPWEGPESGYVTVLKAHDGYRMVYRGGGETTPEVTCVALSHDGIKWEKPRLGMFEVNGSRDNNVIFVGREKGYWESHNFTPFLDTNPAATPDARYKAVGMGRAYPPATPDREKALMALGSPDGIRWRLLSTTAVITGGSFDSQNTVFFDLSLGEYVCYFRAGRSGVRSVMRTTSKDFLDWTPPQWLDFGTAPVEHLYTNAIGPYERDPSLYLGFPMRFVPERTTVGSTHRPTDGLSDAVLISSRDGLLFDRTFLEAFIRPGRPEANWGSAHGNNTPAWGLLQTAPDELSIYWCENYGAAPHVRRGVLRLDGFVSINAPASGGEMVTRPLRCTAAALALNYATSAIGSIRVEVLDSTGRPVAGLTASDCDALYGDEIKGRVRWGTRRDLSALVGQDIRLRFVMRDADLYSVTFASEPGRAGRAGPDD